VPAWRRTLDGLRYVVAGIRSRARRLQRRVEAVLFGSPEPQTIDLGEKPAARPVTPPREQEAHEANALREPEEQVAEKPEIHEASEKPEMRQVSEKPGESGP
jgi:hypothetical protein